MICGACLLSGDVLTASEPSAGDLEFFERQIRPLLAQHCYECHSGASKKIQGGLRLDASAAWLAGGDTKPAVVPGDPDKSLLVRAVRYADSDLQMPPRGKLPAEVIQLFEQWVAKGAPAPTESAAEVTARPTIGLAAGRQFWCYRPIVAPAVPQPQDARWAAGPIDRFIRVGQEVAGLTPNVAADRATLARRLYFDLLGLPPTPEEIDAFVADGAPDAYERLVDRLLASPHLGEHWGRHWLDVARFAESLTLRGFIWPNAWRYRDYVIAAFNDDEPFDRFVREQIAGDLLPAGSLAERQRQLIATTFLALGNTNLEEQDKRQLDMIVVDEQVDTIGKALLGQTIGCARCHDHKFDPIPTRDYYALAGILRSSKLLDHANVSKWVEVPLPLAPEEEAMFAQREAALAAAQARIAELTTVTALRRKALEHLEAQRRRAVTIEELDGIVVDDSRAKKLGEWKGSRHSLPYLGDGYVHDDNAAKGEKTISFEPKLEKDGRYELRFAYSPGANRAADVPVTIFSADGERTVMIDERSAPPIDGRFVSLGEYNFEAAGQSFVLVSNEGTHGHVTVDAVQFLSVDATANTAKKPLAAAELTSAELEYLAQSKSRREAAEEEKVELTRRIKELRAAPQRPTVMSVVERPDSGDVAIHVRGSVHALGEIVPRGFLQVASLEPAPIIPSAQSGRRELAAWLTSPTNPLTARVWANRVWHWLFGQGLVRTTDNFGATGEKPSHPELLDHLASRFVDQGWSTKTLLREILLSRTYRLASSESAEGLARDPENRLLWRMNRRRLEAECLRDAMLVASGQLNTTIGGGTIRSGTKADYGYQDRDTRRGVYVPVFRNAPNELFDAFDVADPSLVVGRRETSTVATQSLYFMNHPFVHEQAQAAAQRLLADRTLTDDDRLRSAFRCSLGREPTLAERRLTTEAVSVMSTSPERRVSAWTMLWQTLFASLDFRYRD